MTSLRFIRFTCRFEWRMKELLVVNFWRQIGQSIERVSG
uniref:Uncharacterized protein n=1 Tax=Lepeophtheirus salmonis TaxID=72036 RepID=A0A0K2TD62_LEPSM